MPRLSTFFFVAGAAAAMACLMTVAMGATEHNVGDKFGWQMPPTPSFYQEWANNHTFTVGDKLVFVHRTSAHSVVEVTKDDFEQCKQRDVIGMYYKGPTVVELKKPGTRYFYCGVGMHCEKGMKLSVDVK